MFSYEIRKIKSVFIEKRTNKLVHDQLKRAKKKKGASAKIFLMYRRRWPFIFAENTPRKMVSNWRSALFSLEFFGQPSTMTKWTLLFRGLREMMILH